jgi:hypothetical protein
MSRSMMTTDGVQLSEGCRGLNVARSPRGGVRIRRQLENRLRFADKT